MACVFRTTRLLPFLLLITLFISCKKTAEEASPEAISRFENIIPKADSSVVDGKAFELNEESKITIATEALKPVGQYLIDFLNEGTGYRLKLNTSDKAPASGIYLTSEGANEALGEEGYSLRVTNELITIKGKPAGVFYGVQTLRQLFPESIEKKSSDTIAF